MSTNKLQTWDIAWKIFFDPNKIWCRGFVTCLLGEEFADYFVSAENILSESTRVGTEGADKSSDSVITFISDKETKRLLTEFQSYYDPSIGHRTLYYALSKAKLLNADKISETWDLPSVFIVNVRKHSGSISGNRLVNLNMNFLSYTLLLPCINAFEILPELQIMMDQGGSLNSVKAMYELYAKVTKGIEAPLEPEEEFRRACALISVPKAFIGIGATSKEVNKMLYDYDVSRPTVIEQIEARGEAQGAKKLETVIIENLMKTRGMSREQATKFFHTVLMPSDSDTDSTKTFRMNRI